MRDSVIPPGPARDALQAARDALAVPHGATAGDEETRNRILIERAGHALVMLNAILDGEHPAPDVSWSVAYLRDRLDAHPGAGYRTWAELVASAAVKAAAR